MTADIIIPIFLFGGITAILWKFFDTRHKERMSIIEKGLVSEDLKYLYASSAMKSNPYSSLKYGMLAVFIGAGILISAFVSTIVGSHEEQMSAGIIFLSGGLGLITFYAIAKKRMDQEARK
jgi:hypothetical protein